MNSGRVIAAVKAGWYTLWHHALTWPGYVCSTCMIANTPYGIRPLAASQPAHVA